MAAQRDKYTWHLRAPFALEFDRLRWWEKVNPKQIHPIAALYELVRRHPRVGELRGKFRHRSWHGIELNRTTDNRKLADKVVDDAFEDLGAGPKPLHCLCLIGLKSWGKLDVRDREYWAMSGGRLKGVDCRSAIEQCSSVTYEALTDLLMKRMREVKPPAGAMQYKVSVTPPGAPEGEPVMANPKAYQQAQEMLAESIKAKPLTPPEMEDAIALNARRAHQAGNFVFSVAPNLSLERAAEILSALYRKQQELDYGTQARARWTDWLPAISDFESGETEADGAKSAVFTRYRRILDGIDFELLLSQTQKLTGWS
ncbi:MAG TPA: hypothetical protein VG734_12420 [Lacunisphaera sp.]|nr:hypothetical protein [Lacunisphaera sp.]